MLCIKFMSTYCKYVLMWMPLNTSDEKSILVQVMAWCHWAKINFLSQFWVGFMVPNGVTRPQSVNQIFLDQRRGKVKVTFQKSLDNSQKSLCHPKAFFSQVKHSSHPGRGHASPTCHMTQFEQSDWLRSENFTNIMIEYIISKLEKQSSLISPECVYTCQWTGSALF